MPQFFKQKKHNCRQAGFAPILVLLVLLAGIGAGTYLVQNRTNFLPQAAKNKQKACNVDLSQLKTLQSCGKNKFARIKFFCSDSLEEKTLFNPQTKDGSGCLSEKDWKKLAKETCQQLATCSVVGTRVKLSTTKITKIVTVKQAVSQSKTAVDKAARSTKIARELVLESKIALSQAQSTSGQKQTKKVKKRLVQIAKDKNDQAQKAIKQARSDAGKAIIASSIQEQRLQKNINNSDPKVVEAYIRAGIVTTSVNSAKFYLDKTQVLITQDNKQLEKLLSKANTNFFEQLLTRFSAYVMPNVYAGQVAVANPEADGGYTIADIEGMAGVTDINGKFTGTLNGQDYYQGFQVTPEVKQTDPVSGEYGDPEIQPVTDLTPDQYAQGPIDGRPATDLTSDQYAQNVLDGRPATQNVGDEMEALSAAAPATVADKDMDQATEIHPTATGLPTDGTDKPEQVTASVSTFGGDKPLDDPYSISGEVNLGVAQIQIDVDGAKVITTNAVTQEVIAIAAVTAVVPPVAPTTPDRPNINPGEGFTDGGNGITGAGNSCAGCVGEKDNQNVGGNSEGEENADGGDGISGAGQ